MTTPEDQTQTPSRRTESLSCTLDDLVERARRRASGGTRFLLGITGAPGAGKSTAAQAIVTALGGQAALVGMDAFHLSNEVLATHGSRGRKGAPDTFDPWGYAHLLQRLKCQQEPIVYAPVFDRRLEESIGCAIAVGRDVPLIVTEGNYLLLDADGWREGKEAIDQVWYLDTGNEERQRRLIQRHEAFGKPIAEAEAWAMGSDQRNADIVESSRERADLIINLVGTYQSPTSARV